jgi:hypothetical protein
MTMSTTNWRIPCCIGTTRALPAFVEYHQTLIPFRNGNIIMCCVV